MLRIGDSWENHFLSLYFDNYGNFDFNDNGKDSLQGFKFYLVVIKVESTMILSLMVVKS